jgi:hypothetical protein
MNLSVVNVNRYDVHFSNTQIHAYAFNGVFLGEPRGLML